MVIKKYIVLFLVLSFCFNLISCGLVRDKMINSRLNELNESSKIRDKCSKEVFEALKNKDREGLKKLFSVSALKLSKNIDENIDYAMNLLDGEITSVDGGEGPSSESSDDGVHVAEETYDYTITTDKGNYLLFLLYISSDSFNKENEGLYMLQLINKEDSEIECDYGQAIRCPGVYVPPASKYTNIKFQDGTEIPGGFKFLKYQEDHSDGKFNIYATIQSNIAYGDVTVPFCFYDSNGEKIGLAVGGKGKLEAGNTFKISLTAEDYDGNELKYEDIANCKFFGIDAR